MRFLLILLVLMVVMMLLLLLLLEELELSWAGTRRVMRMLFIRAELLSRGAKRRLLVAELLGLHLLLRVPSSISTIHVAHHLLLLLGVVGVLVVGSTACV